MLQNIDCYSNGFYSSIEFSFFVDCILLACHKRLRFLCPDARTSFACPILILAITFISSMTEDGVPFVVPVMPPEIIIFLMN